MIQDKNTAGDPRWVLLASAALLLLTLLVYFPSFHYPFINYDDPVYVFQNPHVQSGLSAGSIAWVFTTFDAGNWHPLTWLSLQLDAALFGGQNAGAFHRTNVLLHMANTLLLFLVLRRLTGAVGRSLVVAGLFALHPLHVESVAWVAERKDVLSTFFWFVTMAAYLFYLRGPSFIRYLSVILALALGLLAKPMLVTLPFVLLLLDYWPLCRWSNRGFLYLLLEKMPLLVLVLASCIVTFFAQLHVEAVAPVEELPVTARLGNALWAYVSYLVKMIWPAHLAVHYPHAGTSLSVAQIVASALLLSVITLFVLGPGRRWPYLTVGWLWYLGTLVPVIGLVQVGNQGMADRYTYVPLVGVFLMLTWGAADLAAAWRLPRSYPVAAAVLVLIGCSIRTWQQVGCWASTRHVWECAVAAAENNVMAHVNLGVCYADEGRTTDAKHEFEKAAALDPSRAEPYVNLGNISYDLGLWARAAAEYRAAIQRAPQLPGLHYNLGNALAQLGQREEAVAEYRRAIDLQPADPWPYINLGVQLDYLGRRDEAAAAYRQAIELDPGNALVHSNLGTLLGEMGRHGEALAECRQAVTLDPPEARFHNQLAGMLQDEGRLDEALVEYHKAFELGDAQARQRIQVCERLHTLEPRLEDLIAGRDQPADNGERLAFALLCSQRRQRHYAAAVRLYREAFRADLRLADDLRSAHRFHAAAAASAAGCGQDATQLAEKEKANLRHQALQWLRADLDLWTKLAQNNRPDVRAALEQTLRRWQRDVLFAGVRDPAALERLPEAERKTWRKLWDEVAALRLGAATVRER